MKKILFITIFGLSFIFGSRLNAQSDIRSYVQLNVGADPITFGGDAWSVKPEVGLDFKFINISLSGILTTNVLFKDDYSMLNLSDEVPPSPGDYANIKGRTAYSLMLNLGVDFVKMFNSQSRHGFLLSAGGGLTQLHQLDSYRNVDGEFIRSDMKSKFDYCFSAIYQYQIAEKWKLGIYADLQGIAEYTTFGISLRRYF
jgi:hypothetical protein